MTYYTPVAKSGGRHFRQRSRSYADLQSNVPTVFVTSKDDGTLPSGLSAQTTRLSYGSTQPASDFGRLSRVCTAPASQLKEDSYYDSGEGYLHRGDETEQGLTQVSDSQAMVFGCRLDRYHSGVLD